MGRYAVLSVVASETIAYRVHSADHAERRLKVSLVAVLSTKAPHFPFCRRCTVLLKE